MKRKVLFLLIGCILASVFLSLGAAHAKAVHWIVCSGDPEAHVTGDGYKWFKEQVEKRTNGKVIIDLYWSGSLYSEREGLESIQTGAGQMGAIYASYYPIRLAVSQGFMVPGTVPNPYAGSRIKDELYVKYLKDEINDQNILLAFNSFPDLFGWQTKKPIRTPEDIRGLKLRSAGGIHGELLKALGAVPVHMSTIDAYAAIQKGVLDGGQLSTSSAAGYRLYEVAPYLTIPNFIQMDMSFGMQTKAYRSLPKDLQKVVYQILRELSIQYQRGYVRGAESKMSLWKSAHVFNEQENKAFLEKLTSLRDEYIKTVGQRGAEMLKEASVLYEKYKDLTFEKALELQKTNPVQGITD